MKKSHESAEDYLETILILRERKGNVRSIDIVNEMNYSKPSIGTSMEVFYASHDLGRFVVAFSALEFKDCSPWMARYCTKILPSLEAAAEYIVRHFSD